MDLVLMRNHEGHWVACVTRHKPVFWNGQWQVFSDRVEPISPRIVGELSEMTLDAYDIIVLHEAEVLSPPPSC